jgi:hypothetical protein
VVADATPGVFDAHGRKMPSSLLQDLFPPGPGGNVTAHGRGKAMLETADPGALRRIVEAAGVRPLYSVRTLDGRAIDDVRTYVFAENGATIVALHRDWREGSAVAGARTVELALPRTALVFDVRKGMELGKTDRLRLELDPVAPTILRITELPD